MLSIVIPTYNEEGFLPLLLNSLERQTYRDFEVVVADAHSTDRTREIAVAAGCRVVDGGLPARGRNLGAVVAKGDVLLFLDADVILPGEHFLADVLVQFDARGLDVATCLVDPMSDKFIDRVSHDFYNGYITAMERFLPHAHGPCMMARRPVHDAIKGFDEQVRLAEDHDYAQRAVRIGFRAGIIKEPRIMVSMRRLKRDGYLSIAARYALCEMHMMTLGSVKTDIFRYRFGYTKEVVAVPTAHESFSSHHHV